jgi:hypothetical protein
VRPDAELKLGATYDVSAGETSADNCAEMILASGIVSGPG